MTKYIGSRIVINQKILKQLKQNAIIALEQTGDYVLDEVVNAQVMPFDTGTMQNESTFVDKSKSSSGTVSIVTSTPYGRRLYFHPEYNFKTENNPHAKGKWLEDWSENGKYAKEVKETYALLYKQIGGL